MGTESLKDTEAKGADALKRLVPLAGIYSRGWPLLAFGPAHESTVWPVCCPKGGMRGALAVHRDPLDGRTDLAAAAKRAG